MKSQLVKKVHRNQFYKKNNKGVNNKFNRAKV